MDQSHYWENSSTASSNQQNPSRFVYSDNERGIILIGPSVLPSHSSRQRSTWSRSANLEVVDLTKTDINNSNEIFKQSDEDAKLKKLLEKNPKVEPFLQNLDCPVCLDSFLSILKNGNKLMSTICGHVFCQSCLFASVKANRKCPACRELIFLNSKSKQYVHQLHLPISLCEVSASR